MNLRLSIALLFYLPLFLFGQTPETVYKKILPGQDNSTCLGTWNDTKAFFKIPGDLDFYALKINLSDSDEMDIGIFDEATLPELVPGAGEKTIFYDSSLIPLFSYQLFSGITSDPKIFGSFQGNIFGEVVDVNNIETLPDLGLDGIYNSVLWKLGSDGSQLSPEYLVSDQTEFGTPDFPGPFPIAYAAFGFDAGSLGMYDKASIIMDSQLVHISNLWDSHIVNDTLEFSVEEEFGYLVAMKNLVSGEINFTQVNAQEAGGSVANRGLFPSDESGHFYHLGVVRGTNTEIGIDGTLFVAADQDSLYHIFLRKEGPELSWTSHLFSYNNLYPDSLYNNDGAGLDLNLENTEIIEKTDAIYIAAEVFINNGNGSLPDTIVLVNAFEDTLRVADSYESILGSDTVLRDYNRNLLFKISNEGEVLIEFSYDKIPISVCHHSYNYLLELNGLLALSFQYIAQQDTIIDFTYKYVGGEESLAQLLLPAGSGAVLLWLNEDLAIVDQWIFEYTPIGFSGGVLIQNVMEYGGDSILVYGLLSNVLTSLDPFGVMSPEYYSGQRSFFTFISAPEFLSTDTKKDALSFSIYPNPSAGEVSLHLNRYSEVRFEVTSIEGKHCDSGLITSQNQRLDLSGLENGIYLITLYSDTFRHTEKVVLQR